VCVCVCVCVCQVVCAKLCVCVCLQVVCVCLCVYVCVHAMFTIPMSRYLELGKVVLVLCLELFDAHEQAVFFWAEYLWTKVHTHPLQRSGCTQALRFFDFVQRRTHSTKITRTRTRTHTSTRTHTHHFCSALHLSRWEITF